MKVFHYRGHTHTTAVIELLLCILICYPPLTHTLTHSLTHSPQQWEPVEYFDNKVICDLVEAKHQGIISVLDEECLRPGDVGDAPFLTKLIQTIGQHKHFITHEMLDYEGRKTINRDQFRLLHYAGEVTYTVVGFVDKNNDLLYRSLKEAANSSQDPILHEIFPESELLSQKRPKTVSYIHTQS